MSSTKSYGSCYLVSMHVALSFVFVAALEFPLCNWPVLSINNLSKYHILTDRYDQSTNQHDNWDLCERRRYPVNLPGFAHLRFQPFVLLTFKKDQSCIRINTFLSYCKYINWLLDYWCLTPLLTLWYILWEPSTNCRENRSRSISDSNTSYTCGVRTFSTIDDGPAIQKLKYTDHSTLKPGM